GGALVLLALVIFLRRAFTDLRERLRYEAGWIQVGAAVGCSGLLVHSLADFNLDRKSTRLNSSHVSISYAVFCLKKKKRHSSNSHFPSHTKSHIILLDSRPPYLRTPLSGAVRTSSSHRSGTVCY